MSPNSFDAEAYQATGRCPWTFFAFPRKLADADGMPPDQEVRELFKTIQEHGIPAAVWSDPSIPDTLFFVCPYESRDALHGFVTELEQQGRLPKGFLAERCERLARRT